MPRQGTHRFPCFLQWHCSYVEIIHDSSAVFPSQEVPVRNSKIRENICTSCKLLTIWPVGDVHTSGTGRHSVPNSKCWLPSVTSIKSKKQPLVSKSIVENSIKNTLFGSVLYVQKQFVFGSYGNSFVGLPRYPDSVSGDHCWLASQISGPCSFGNSFFAIFQKIFNVGFRPSTELKIVILSSGFLATKKTKLWANIILKENSGKHRNFKKQNFSKNRKFEQKLKVWWKIPKSKFSKKSKFSSKIEILLHNRIFSQKSKCCSKI